MNNEQLLKEILAQVRETRDIVNSMNKQRRFANFIWAIKWIIILFVLYGAYSAAQPYLQIATQTINNVNNLNSQVQQLNSMPTNSIQNMFKRFVK